MNKHFISIRWKLVSTYLLLVFISLVLINTFINASLTKHLMEEKIDNLINQCVIVADQIAPKLTTIHNNHFYKSTLEDIKALSLRLDTRVMVVNNEGLVVVDSYDDYEGRSIKDVEEVKNALKGNTSQQTYNFENIGRTIYVAVPVYNPGEITGAVFMSSSPSDVFSKTKEVSASFYQLSIAAIIITTIISFIFTDIFASPIEGLTQVVKEVAHGDKTKKARVVSNDELGNLAIAFNIMVSRLYKVDDMRKKFVSNVSHELRTPIAAMKIIAETLTHSKPDSIDVYADFMIDINTELDRLNKIIDTLLDLVNLENEDVVLNYEPIVYNNLVRHTVRTLRPLAEKKGITLTYTADEVVETVLDHLKISQCLMNIINNAIKYTPDGGTIRVELYRHKSDVIVKVKDSGIGIPRQDLPYIFDRFYRVDSARSRDTGGSGLGLSIAYQIVSLHHGSIEVMSEPDVGTDFLIILPIRTER